MITSAQRRVLYKVDRVRWLALVLGELAAWVLIGAIGALLLLGIVALVWLVWGGGV